LSAAAAEPTALVPAASKAPAQLVVEDASTPIAKKDRGRFMQRHQSFVERAKAGSIDLLFLGDSITEGWEKAPNVWAGYYGKYKSAGFGINGDMTQHVLWRITNGELDGISPKVLVLMIGTNNSAANTAEQIVAADRKILEIIRAKLPSTKVILLALLPRGPRKNPRGTVEDHVKRMEVIRAVNAELAKLDDGKNVRFLDLGPKFLDADGKIPSALMPDQLHPGPAGYTVWAEAMQPLLNELMR